MPALETCLEQADFSGLVESYLTRRAPAHRGARLLLAHWHARAAEGGGFVVGRDVPARPLSRILGALALYEPIGNDFRIRLAGTGWRRRFGRDVTGQWLSAALGPSFPAMAADLRECLDDGHPRALEARLLEGARLCLCSELVLLPVLAPDGRTPWILAGLFFHDWRL